MDGAIEPPWMGLRRVLPTHTTPANKHNSQSRLLSLPLQVQGCKPYEGIFTSSRAAMDAAFRLYPEARSITVGPLQ